MTTPIPNSIASSLEAYRPDRYWAVWQTPESRYAYMIDESASGWLIVLESERAGIAYLLDDARTNGRDATQYRLDELTLPEAFDAVRTQPLPFKSSFGSLVQELKGLLVFNEDGNANLIPL